MIGKVTKGTSEAFLSVIGRWTSIDERLATQLNLLYGQLEYPQSPSSPRLSQLQDAAVGIGGSFESFQTVDPDATEERVY